MKKVTFTLALCGALMSCKPTAVSSLSEVLTVDEFTHKPDLRTKVLEECRRNPGQMGKDPNCINADKSAGDEFIKTRPPRF
jgi:hypothetical protein